jgi:peptidoglycan-associated lipoprotein
MRNALSILTLTLAVVSLVLFSASCAKKTVTPERGRAYEEAPTPDETGITGRTGDYEYEEDAYRSTREGEGGREGALRAETDRQAMMATRREFENEDIYFAFDSAALSRRAQEKLREKARWMKQYPTVSAVIEGHCDERGTSEYNLALGDRRAESAKAYMVNLGISPARLVTISYGEERPADPRHTEEAWARNRRAHFEIE